MRIVFVTQQIDPDHPILGATVSKVRALAERCDEVVVLADRVVPGVLPTNCRTYAFGSATRMGRGFRFLRALARELARRPRPAAVVAHMCPIYAVLAAPVVRPLGGTVVLWFTHWRRTPLLALAAQLSNAIATVDRRSVPLRSKKIAAIGHGIDMTDFHCLPDAGDGDSRPALHALALGRYSQAKGLMWIVRAVALAREQGTDIRLTCRGAVGNDREADDRAELSALVAELSLEGIVELGGPIPRSDVPALLRSVDVLVNNMKAGATDKVVYEACASCVPVLVSNPPFADLFGDLEPPLLFARESPAELADRLVRLAALTHPERRALGDTLRQRVVEAHAVGRWADRLLEVCRA